MLCPRASTIGLQLALNTRMLIVAVMEAMKRIISRFTRWWLPDAAVHAAQRQYIACVNGARNSFFYTEFGVADTARGRFEMVIVHVALLLRRMRRDAPALEQESLHLVEAFFRDMDHSFREMGISDLRVGGQVKGCVGILYGRCAAYDTALSSSTGLEDAILRNVFAGGGAPSDAGLKGFAAYMRAADAMLNARSNEEIIASHFNWPS